MLAAAREEVLAARKTSGTDPTVVDAVLRRLDVRGALFD
jgi:CPA1 family monovalent cation:H+ antiporter